MPKLRDLSEIMTDRRLLEVFAPARPERIDLSTTKGTTTRMLVIKERGLGGSKSEVAHIALHIGLYSLEEILGIKVDLLE